jgi:hypothetical protein
MAVSTRSHSSGTRFQTRQNGRIVAPARLCRSRPFVRPAAARCQQQTRATTLMSSIKTQGESQVRPFHPRRPQPPESFSTPAARSHSAVQHRPAQGPA